MNVIVIGASSGIGHDIARTYAERGCRVGVCARRLDRLEKLCAEFPDTMTSCGLDVTADDAPQRFRNFVDSIGGIDLLVYCAGCGWNNPDLTLDFDMRTVRTNVDGFTAIIDTAFDIFSKSGPATTKRGQIVAITSIAGTHGIGISASYSASKRYEWTFLEALSQLARVRHIPVDITDIRPGFIDTPLLDTTAHRYPMLMTLDQSVPRIVRVIDKRRHVAVINRRWACVTALWRRIPRFIWRNLPIRF